MDRDDAEGPGAPSSSTSSSPNPTTISPTTTTTSSSSSIISPTISTAASSTASNPTISTTASSTSTLCTSSSSTTSSTTSTSTSRAISPTTATISMAPSPPPPLRAVELFSGIGGFHLSLLASRAARLAGATVAASLDVSPLANAVYRRNFPASPAPIARALESLPLARLEDLAPDLLLASPPCQPFARAGLRRDDGDPRSAGLAGLLALLGAMRRKPRFVLVENVAGFERSRARRRLLDTLDRCGGYGCQEFLLSPTALGVPNSRLRYFLLARRGGLGFETSGGVMETLPGRPAAVGAEGRQVAVEAEVVVEDCSSVTVSSENVPAVSSVVTASSNNIITSPSSSSSPSANNITTPYPSITSSCNNITTSSFTTSTAASPPRRSYKHDSARDLARKLAQDRDPSVCTLRRFLDHDDGGGDAGDAGDTSDPDSLLVPRGVLLRYGRLLDIVTPDSRRSNCFTGAYGRYAEGTGSVLAQGAGGDVAAAFAGGDDDGGGDDEERSRRLEALRLRYFSPGEVARLHGFPDWFAFPDEVTRRQRWRLLGNSLNVTLVAELIDLLLR